jgi:7-cyano-7-deazaguanine synthase
MRLSSIDGEFSGRNAVLLLAAGALMPASASLVLGIHSGTPYYDCTNAFLDDVNRLFDGYFGGTMPVDAPFVGFGKHQVYEYAQRAHVPLDLTFSCERTSGAPCGDCPSCLDREAYFGHL